MVFGLTPYFAANRVLTLPFRLTNEGINEDLDSAKKNS